MRYDIVAFDIHGTLTEDKVLSVYRQLESDGEVIVGLITASPKVVSERFINKHDLSPDFVYNSLLKARALISTEVSTHGSQTGSMDLAYVGDRRTDQIYSLFAGWNFYYPSDLETFRPFDAV